MKINTVVCLCLFLALAGCKEQPEIASEEKIDWNKASVSVMEYMRPRVMGSWTIKSIDISPYPPSTREIGIVRDTTLVNVATMDFTQVKSTGVYLSSNDVTGVIRFKNRVYPIGFKMLATSDGVYKREGSQVFGLLEYRFPVGSHLTEPEENYLRYLNLLGSNFEMEVSADGKTMIWKGLGQAIKSMLLEKN
ncbi:MAG: hypothetical protein ACQUHE_10615 [Bacteroidia bacterium]